MSDFPHGAYNALRNYQQADETGEMVKVSRQAVDEVLLWMNAPAEIEALRAENERLRGEVYESAAKVAHNSTLGGTLGDWDKGWNHACVTIGHRLREAAFKETTDG